MDPDFLSTVRIPYRFGTKTELNFAVYDIDVDPKNKNVTSREEIGQVRAQLSEIVTQSKESGMTLKLINSSKKYKGKDVGHLVLRCNELIQ